MSNLTPLDDTIRMAALTHLGLMDTPTELAFDRITRLATRLLDTPVAIVSLVTADRQFFKSCVGLTEPWTTTRTTPLSHSFCQYVVMRDQPLLVSDAREHQLLADNLAIPDLGVIAYAGIPLRLADGTVVGALAAIDTVPHHWAANDIAILHDLAAAVSTELQLRAELRTRHLAEQALERHLARATALYQIARALASMQNLPSMLQEVTTLSVPPLMADRVMLFTLDRSASQIEHVVTAGPGQTNVEMISLGELNQDLIGWSLQTQQPVLSSKAEADSCESLQAQQRRPATDCGSVIVAPLLYHEHSLGAITAINRREDPDFTPDDLALLSTIAQQIAVMLTNARLFQDVEQLATTDPLTGLANRRGFDHIAQQLLKQTQRLQQPLAILLLDIDHFKLVNDTYGHVVGDQVLRATAARCQTLLRGMDLIGRYGGEEFVVLLPETDRVMAWTIAERLRDGISATPIATPRAPLLVTISLGIAVWTPAIMGLDELLEQADKALYRAKQAGRNQVSL